MKHLFLFLSLGVLFSTSYSQVYHPLLKQNAYWNETYGHTHGCEWNCYPPTPGCDLQTNHASSFLGDTLTISNKIYWEVRSNIEMYCGLSSQLPEAVYEKELKGYLREDTAERKVYTLYPGTSIDTLLYDFTLQVGDTVRSFAFTNEYHLTVVTSIDSVFIDNSYRKELICDVSYNLTYDDTFYVITVPGFYQIIEGIGSTGGLIGQADPNPFETFSSFDCYSENGQVLYPVDAIGCEFITDVEEISSSKDLNIFPNPFSENLIIESTGSAIELLNIYSTSGQIIYSNNALDRRSELFISTESWEAGIYLAILITPDSVFSQKLIKL